MIGHTISVTREQRLNYAQTLLVYGKDHTYVSLRFHNLLDKFTMSFLYCN